MHADVFATRQLKDWTESQCVVSWHSPSASSSLLDLQMMLISVKGVLRFGIHLHQIAFH
jgi:hypothetical protein